MMNQNVTDLQEQLARVCAERDRYREALLPFALAAEHEDRQQLEWNGKIMHDNNMFEVEMKYFRAALAALGDS